MNIDDYRKAIVNYIYSLANNEKERIELLEKALFFIEKSSIKDKSLNSFISFLFE